MQSNRSAVSVLRLVVAAAVGASIHPLTARAAHPLVTEDTGTQGRGKYQLELQAERGRDKESGTTEKSTRSAVVLSYGVHDNADVILAFPYERVETEAGGTTTSKYGREDVSLDVKWRFHEKDKTSWAIKSGIRFATGDEDKGFGSGKANFSALLIGSFDMQPLMLHTSAGYIGNRNTVGEKSHVYQVSAGGWYNVGDFKLVFDVGRFTNVDRESDQAVWFGILGFIHSFNDDLDFDLGVKWGLSDPEVDSALLAGITWRF